MGVLISIETGSEPVSLEKLALTGPFQDFYQFAEDWNNVLPEWLPNEWMLPYFSGCFHISFWSDHTLIVKYLFLSTREIV